MNNQQFLSVLEQVRHTLTSDLGDQASRTKIAILQIDNAMRMLDMEQRNAWAERALLYRAPVQREPDGDIVEA